jgi:hypothetical protein
MVHASHCDMADGDMRGVFADCDSVARKELGIRCVVCLGPITSWCSSSVVDQARPPPRLLRGLKRVTAGRQSKKAASIISYI